MKKISLVFKTFLFWGLPLCSFAMNVQSLAWNGTPYIGGDLQSRHMAFKKPYVSGIDKNNNLGGNLYLGLNVNPFFGLEFGFEQSSKKSTNPNLPQSSLFMGIDVLPISGVEVQQKTTVRGYHANFIGFMPVNTPFNLHLVGLFGIARLQTKISLKNLNIDTQKWSRAFNFEKSIWTPRIGLGVQNMINDHLGLRALVVFEKTSRFGQMPEAQNTGLILQPKNSFIPSIGLLYKF